MKKKSWYIIAVVLIIQVLTIFGGCRQRTQGEVRARHQGEDNAYVYYVVVEGEEHQLQVKKSEYYSLGDYIFFTDDEVLK